MNLSKDKKTGKWLCQFYYTDWQGNRKKKFKRGFRTKLEAEASKEALTNEFERQAAAREQSVRYERKLAERREQESAELERYY